jgi:putative SbcD/Mre11-related phosphoesterase
MDISDIQPIQNEPVLFIKKRKIIVIADLHIGIESRLRELGLNIPSQTNKMNIKLIDLFNKLKPREIILLGDIKHNIPSPTIKERIDVKKFLLSIEGYGNVHLIPGNHDGLIHKLTSGNITIHGSDGLVFENIGFMHGHRWPSIELMNCDQVIFGHTHPTIMFSDNLNHRSFEQCWVRGGLLKEKIKIRYPDTKYPEVLIMPAFNPLCGGIAVNQDDISGPLGKFIDVENSQIYLIDGAFLGKLKDIK